MRKIGIITINDYENYGNRLQNYALKKTIEKLGFEVDSVRFISTEKLGDKKKLVMLVYIDAIIEQITRTKKIVFKLVFRKKSELIEEKHLKFKDFSDIFLSEYFVNLKNPLDINKLKVYDFFVTGSDQVWNPYHPENILDFYFLNFVEKSKRIAYAPSIALSDIPIELKAKYTYWLSNMGKISVREKTGSKIIRELVGVEPPVLVDPTLLLSKEEWLNIKNRSDVTDIKKYILMYFLGEVHKDLRKFAKELSIRYEFEIIDIFNKNKSETYNNGPSEFVSLFSDAELVLTDSFHGTVFSILFEKPFIVSKRRGKGIFSKMYSRIEALLDMFNFKSREFEKMVNSKEILSQDFTHVQEILDHERRKSYDYLKSALYVADKS